MHWSKYVKGIKVTPHAISREQAKFVMSREELAEVILGVFSSPTQAHDFTKKGVI